MLENSPLKVRALEEILIRMTRMNMVS